MKKFIKFIPVALGLLTLASCSNDELLGEKAFDASQLQEDEILVNLEEASDYGNAFTRSYTDRTMKKHRWTETIDQLQVYGKAFGAYDLYAFSWTTKDDGSTVGVFKRQHKMSNIDDAKWALFPLKSINHGEWHMIDAYNNYTEVNINLPEFIEYSAAYDAPNYATGADTDPYYLDELPRFGEVSGVKNGEAVQTKLNYMTAVLRLQLAGIPAYASGVKIQMYENGNRTQPLVLNGDFTTRIGLNNTIQEGAALLCDKSDLNYGNQYAIDEDEDGAIYVHIPAHTALNERDNRKGVLYIPLPVWDTESSIVISTSQDYTGEDGAVDHAAAAWTEYKELSKKPILRGKVYGNAKEYNLALDGTGPGAISDALDLIETDEETITIVANDEIEVCATGNATTIQIPNNNPSVKNIIIDLSNGLFGCAADQTLKIVYQSDANPFTGNVTLIAGAPTVNTAEPVKLDVNLPKSGFGIVAAQALAGDLTNVIDQDAYGDVDIDAEEFVVGNADKYTPTTLTVTPLKFSTNVKTFTVAQEGQLNGDFEIDQQTNPKPEDWTFGAVETININGVVNGSIDATTNTKPTYKVAVNVFGEQIENSNWGYPAIEAPTVYGNIDTRGAVAIGTATIKAGKYVKWSPSSDNRKATISGDITAEDGITADGYAEINGDIESTKGTVALKGHVIADAQVKAEGDINVTEQAYISGAITSNTGNITIDNNFSEKDWMVADPLYPSDIEATAGSVSLNQAVNKEKGKYLVSKFGGDITAGTDFTMTGLTYTSGDITLSGKATINVAPQEGNCVAVAGSVTYTLGDNYEMDLLQGYVRGLDATEGPVKLTFATTAAYAALTGVTEYDNVLPQNESVWNGDWELEKYDNGTPGQFAADLWAIDGDRIWTATQLGYMMTYPQTDVELRSDINLNDEEWRGIDADNNTTITGLIDSKKKTAYYWYKTIRNINLTNPESRTQAGFFATVGSGSTLDVTNIKFMNVKTTFDMVALSAGIPKTHMRGVGAVVGECEGAVTLNRVSVKLAGDKFGCDGNINKRSAYIGGMVGLAKSTSTFLGCDFDGGSTVLCGWYNIGGLVGRSVGDFTVNVAMAQNKLVTVPTSAENVNVAVSFVDNSKVNDLYQGMTGRFAGSVGAGVEISEIDDELVNAEFAPTGAKDRGLDNKAFKITGLESRYFFNRAEQTLIGHDGKYEDNASTYMINEEQYQIYQEGSTSGNYSPGKKHFYDLTLEAHQD